MKFLIVDDDKSVHIFLERILRDYGQCDSAMNGLEALDLFEKALAPGQTPYDAVFMDIMMPGLDGHEASVRLRDLESRLGSGEQDFKLVMITALSDTKNVSKAFFQTYASAYLVKPFDKENIIEELRSIGIIGA
ncbi:MAG: response regulator [Desulfovibrionaceae bacterium]|nr:response regulator [Desulfovibrionaceae bacterium]MDD4952123.1 response regulator [Desulfovibrionaceae bacterium]